MGPPQQGQMKQPKHEKGIQINYLVQNGIKKVKNLCMDVGGGESREGGRGEGQACVPVGKADGKKPNYLQGGTISVPE